MDDFIEIRLDVFENSGQRARVRKALTINALIQEIFKEFDDINADSPERYGLYLKGSDRPLNNTSTLAQLDIQPHDYFIFDYLKQNIRQMLNPNEIAYFREESQGKSYEIRWQPAVIGRPSNEAEHNMVLAVNLQGVPNGRTISRRHAEVSYFEGDYYLEPLAENNPTYVNGQEIPFNHKRKLRNGDRVTIGKQQIHLIFVHQPVRASASQVKNTGPARPAGQRDTTKPSVQSASPQSQQQPQPPVSGSVVEPTIRPDPISVSAASVPTARLRVENSSQPLSIGKVLVITETPFVLGRTLENLAESDVSRQHAELLFDPGSRKFYIKDLNSTNGVMVNGARIPPGSPCEITPGSLIQLGAVLKLRFDN
jgi:pSer/pThr/pTyr-binding forkhead associated (FHA) protein